MRILNSLTLLFLASVLQILSKMVAGSFDDNEGSALKSGVTGASSGFGYSSAADVASKSRSDNDKSDSAKGKMKSPNTKVVSESQRITNRYFFNSRFTPFNPGIGDSKSHNIPNCIFYNFLIIKVTLASVLNANAPL